MTNVLQGERERVGRRIRAARKQAGLSHDRLAATVGTSRQHLIRIEKGQHAPRPDMLARIAEATGKSVDFFTAADDEEADDQLSRAAQGLVSALTDELRRSVQRSKDRVGDQVS